MTGASSVVRRPSFVIVDYGVGNLRNVYKALEAAGAAARIVTQPGELAGARGIVLPGVGAFGDAAANLRRAGFETPLRDAIAAGAPLLGICVGMQLLFDESEEMGRHSGLGVIPGRVVRFDLTPQPPSLAGKGEPNSPLLAGEGSGVRSSLAGEGSGVRSGEGSGVRSGEGSGVRSGEGSGVRSSLAGEGSGVRSGEGSGVRSSDGAGVRLKVPQIGWNQLRHAGTDPLLAGVADGAYAYFVHSYYCAPDDPAHIVATTDYGITYASVVRRGSVWGIQCHPEKSQAVGLRVLGNFVRVCEGS